MRLTAPSLGTVQLKGGTFADSWLIVSQAKIGAVAVAAVAAQLAAAQLKNPAGSGVEAYVDSITIDTGTTTDIVTVQLFDTDLATDNGAAIDKQTFGTAAHSHMRSTNSGALGGTLLGKFAVPANDDKTIKFDPPIGLLPGHGIAAQCGTVNLPLNVTVQFREY